jgi:dTDP-4-dehydrorhamnose reductase
MSGLLVLGDTGMLGSAVLAAARARGLDAWGASRRGEVRLDIRDEAALTDTVASLKPDLIVNAAALVSIPACEADPGEAWAVNAKPAAVLARAARAAGARVVHVSTDHYFIGDGRKAHAEDAPVTLVNEYARSKYAAEALALTHADTLVVRTNMIGLSASFGAWARGVIERDEAATLFEDSFVSILDIWTLADAILDLGATKATAVLNVGSREVFSKADLVRALAAAMDRTLTRAVPGSVAATDVPRPDSLGLDVRKAEALLGRRLPTLKAVAARFAKEADRHALAA